MDAQSDPETHAIIGAAFEVHQQLGPGFLEAVYQEAMAVELSARGLRHAREVPLAIQYKGRLLGAPYRADLICEERFLVELKATVGLGRVDEAQVIHYLKATGLSVGLLLNFGTLNVQVRRLSNTRRVAGDQIDYLSP